MMTNEDKNTDSDKSRKPRFGRYRKPRPGADMTFSYKDPETLKLFVTEYGKIVPRRISRLNAKQQRELAREVKRARILAMLPFTPQTREA